MKKLLISAVFGLLSLTARAEDTTTWSNDQIALQTILAAETYIDYKQTMDIKNNLGIHETNVILGRHPSDKKIEAYFLTCAVAEVVAVNLFPEHRTQILGTLSMLEFVVVAHNKYIGLNGKF